MRFLFGVVVAACVLWRAEARSISVEVRAPWPVYLSSSIMQAAEFVADFDAAQFWHFADGLCEIGTSQRIDALLQDASPDAQAELQALAYETAAHALPAALHHILDTSLGLGAYAPAAQFYYSLLDYDRETGGGGPCGADASAFAVLLPGGRALCSAADVAALQAGGPTAACPAGQGECAPGAGVGDSTTSGGWDHVYPGPGAAAAQVHLVLYGALGSGPFCEMHAAAKSAAAESAWLRYSARHAFLGQKAVSADTGLQGYGVFLDIKNMEYNTADTNDGDADKDKDKGEGKKDAAKDKDPLAGVTAGVDEQGLFFSTLLARRPGDAGELGMLREELARRQQERGQAEGKMKVWKIKDLGVQAVQAIITATDPAAKFAEIVHSFPSHATQLSSLRMRATVLDSLGAWQSAGMQQFLPHNALLVNGLRVDLGGSTFNVFDLLAAVRKELQTQARLQALGLAPARQEGLLRAAAAISSGRAVGQAAQGGDSATEGVVRIDVSKGGKHVVAFLNNLEKDAVYKRWPKSLRQMMMPSWSLHSIARNLYTLIFVVDPLTLEGTSLFMQMQAMHAQQYPVRFGIVPVCQDPEAAVGAGGLALEAGAGGDEAPAGRSDVCRLFAAARKHGEEVGFNFLGTLAAFVGEELQASMRGAGGADMDDVDPSTLPFPVVSRGRLKTLFADTLAVALSSHSALEHVAAATIALGAAEPLAYASNCTTYLSERGLRPNSFSLNGIVKEAAEIQGLMQLLGREQYILTQYARKKLITDKTPSIFSAVLALGRAYPRYHPLLEATELSFPDAPPSAQALAGTPFLEARVRVAPFLEATRGDAAECPGSCIERACNTTVVVAPVSAKGLESALAATTWLMGPGACAHRLALALCPAPAQRACVGGCSDVAKAAGAAALLQVELGAGALAAVHALLAAAVGGLDPVAAVEGAGVGGALLARVRGVYSGTEGPSALAAAEASARHVQDAFSLPTACDEFRPSAHVSYNARRVAIALDGVSAALHEADLALLAGIEWARAGQHLQPLLRAGAGLEVEEEAEGRGASDLLLRLASFAGEYGGGSKRHDVHGLLDEAGFTSSSGDSSAPAATAPFMFRVPAAQAPEGGAEGGAEGESAGGAAVQVYCVVDPLSIAGQRAAAVLPLLTASLQLPVTVILVPRTELSDFPLQVGCPLPRL